MNFRRPRKHEANNLGKALDSLFHEMGPQRAITSAAAEILIRRLVALLIVKETGDWTLANEIDVGGSRNLLTPSHHGEIRRKAKMKKDTEGFRRDSRGATKEKNKAASEKGGVKIYLKLTSLVHISWMRNLYIYKS